MKHSIPLICPDCHRALVRDTARCYCDGCSREFPCDDGIPAVLPSSIIPFKELERAYHDEVSAQFEGMHNLESARVTTFKEDYLSFLSKLPRGSVVLEVGCGTGWDALRLSREGIDVYLTDISVSMVKEAKERLGELEDRDVSERDDGAHFFVIDAESIPFPAESFDAVLITAALHHMPSAKRCLAEMARVCKPGGLVVLGFEPNTWPYYTVLPLRRLLSIAIKGIKLFLRSPVEALRKIRRLKVSRGSIVEVEWRAQERYSPADRQATGFTGNRLSRLIGEASLDLISVSPAWYLNGFVQEYDILKRFRAPSKRIESFLVKADRLISRIPLIKSLNWHWNAVARKPESSAS